MSRDEFRAVCTQRDDYTCVIPWCDAEVDTDPSGSGEVHHIIERELWEDGGYIPKNGACVCNLHHQYAEATYIPPQAFWRWAGITDIPLPQSVTGLDTVTTIDVTEQGKSVKIAYDKWGDAFNAPPHGHLREYHKYPSSRHLLPLYWQSERGTAEERTGRDDTGLSTVSSLVDVPLVCTVKMDGSNAMLVADEDNPVRARNGSHAKHDSFDQLKQLYWQKGVYNELPEHLQVFGEWLYAEHSIHYGCDCDEPCEDVGPALRDYFQVFGVYDTRYDIWLSWPETEHWAKRLGFLTTPLVEEHTMDDNTYTDEQTFTHHFTEEAERIVDMGHEGIIIRSKFPFHYGEFGERLGKYVRPNHVTTDEHWSQQQIVQNVAQ